MTQDNGMDIGDSFDKFTKPIEIQEAKNKAYDFANGSEFQLTVKYEDEKEFSQFIDGLVEFLYDN